MSPYAIRHSHRSHLEIKHVALLRSEQERVAAIVTECMESAAALKVRLVVDYGVGDNWLEAH